MTQTDAFEVQITYPDPDTAGAAAAFLVDHALAACAQIVQVSSVFIWEEDVVAEPEWLLTAKTTRACLPAIEARVSADHPYEVPQITALPIAWGAAGYLDWIARSCQPPVS